MIIRDNIRFVIRIVRFNQAKKLDRGLPAVRKNRGRGFPADLMKNFPTRIQVRNRCPAFQMQAALPAFLFQDRLPVAVFAAYGENPGMPSRGQVGNRLRKRIGIIALRIEKTVGLLLQKDQRIVSGDVDLRKHLLAVKNAVALSLHQGVETFLLLFLSVVAQGDQKLVSGGFRLPERIIGKQREIRIAEVADDESDRLRRPVLQRPGNG